MGIISNIFYQASRIYLKVGIPTILTYLTNWYFSTYLPEGSTNNTVLCCIRRYYFMHHPRLPVPAKSLYAASQHRLMSANLASIVKRVLFWRIGQNKGRRSADTKHFNIYIYIYIYIL